MMKQRVKGEIATPVAVLALMDKLGPTKAAKELGTSTTTLYKAKKLQKISRVFEVAAAGVLSGAPAIAASAPKRGRKPRVNGHGKTELVLFEVPANKAELVRRVAAKVGGLEVA